MQVYASAYDLLSHISLITKMGQVCRYNGPYTLNGETSLSLHHAATCLSSSYVPDMHNLSSNAFPVSESVHVYSPVL